MNQAERLLTLSDFATKQEHEIAADPFKFLGLPPNSSLADARRAYIGQSRIYLGDLINPRLPNLTAGQLTQSFSPEELKANLADISQLLAASPQDAQLAEIEKDKQRRLQALEIIRAMAHEKMVVLNRAYELIKNRVGSQRASTISGYDSETVFNQREQAYEQLIETEGHGEITIYDKPFEYWVAGPYLNFDWGTPPEHPWAYCDEGFQQVIPIKHLFAHLEIQKGQKPPVVLLEPFLDCFSLTKTQGEALQEVFKTGLPTKEIMNVLGVAHYSEIDIKDESAWLKALRFEKQVNMLLNLNPLDNGEYWASCDIGEFGFTVRLTDDQKLILKGLHGETVFSEADFILMQTLAYGPLLKP